MVVVKIAKMENFPLEEKILVQNVIVLAKNVSSSRATVLSAMMVPH